MLIIHFWYPSVWYCSQSYWTIKTHSRPLTLAFFFYLILQYVVGFNLKVVDNLIFKYTTRSLEFLPLKLFSIVNDNSNHSQHWICSPVPNNHNYAFRLSRCDPSMRIKDICNLKLNKTFHISTTLIQSLTFTYNICN
jgi:hypothetical protein